MRRTLRTPRRIALLAVLGAVTLAACSGGGDSADTSEPAPSTTKAATTTTAKAATTSEAATTTTEAPAVSPLTGLAPLDPTTLGRPALVVKIDNHPGARPQSGLNSTDLVYEENVEQLTRFAAVFQSGGSDPVGPIRSGRTQDVELLGSLNAPLFAWSGGNARVTAAIDASDLVNIGAPHNYGPGGYFRSSDRKAPHNLYASTTKLFGLAPAGKTAPPAQFTYRPLGEAPTQGEPAAGVHLSMDGVKVQWLWDASKAAYLRSQDGKPHLTDGDQVVSSNVVVLYVDYRRSAADARSPEAVTTGTGETWVFTGGNWVQGTWSRADRLQPFTLKDQSGQVIELTPGRTWIELARAGKGAVIPAGADPASVGYP